MSIILIIHELNVKTMMSDRMNLNISKGDSYRFINNNFPKLIFRTSGTNIIKEVSNE